VTEIVLALGRSLRTLGRGRVWLLLLRASGGGAGDLDRADGVCARKPDCDPVEQPPMTWLAGWGAVWLAKLGAVLGGWLLMLAAAFITAMLLAAIFVMPLLLNHVALADYPELARVGKDSVVAGAWNSMSLRCCCTSSACC
jgi:CysZ protein